MMHESSDWKSRVPVFLLTVLLLLSLSAGLSSCNRSTGSARTSPKVGAILPLTGDAATYGTSCRKGMQVAASQEGIQFTVEDSAADPGRAISAYRKLVDVDRVGVILGDMFSAPTLAFAPLAQSRGILVISPTSGAEAVPRTGTCIFSLYPTAKQEGEFMARFLVDRFPDGGKVGILASQEEVYRGLAKGFSAGLGGSTTWSQAFIQLLAPDTRDFKNPVTKFVHLQGLRAIYVAGGKAFVANLIKQARQQGYAGTVLSQSTLFDATLARTFGKYLDGVLFSGPFFDPNANTEPTKTFVTAYQEKFGNVPDVWAAYGYDAVLVAAKAIRSCPDCDGRKLATLVSQTSLQGTTGPIRFDKNGIAIRSFRVFTFRNGDLVPVR